MARSSAESEPAPRHHQIRRHVAHRLIPIAGRLAQAPVDDVLQIGHSLADRIRAGAAAGRARWRASCRAERRRNGDAPVSISCSTMPNERCRFDDRRPPPCACSGDMYVTVPTAIPAPSGCDHGHALRGSVVAGADSFAIPKSMTFTRPSAVIMTLAGFRSRWTIPISWAGARASVISSASAIARDAGIGPSGHQCAERLPADEFHHDARQGVDVRDLVDHGDVGMFERGSGARLLHETGASGGLATSPGARIFIQRRRGGAACPRHGIPRPFRRRRSPRRSGTARLLPRRKCPVTGGTMPVPTHRGGRSPLEEVARLVMCREQRSDLALQQVVAATRAVQKSLALAGRQRRRLAEQLFDAPPACWSAHRLDHPILRALQPTRLNAPGGWGTTWSAPDTAMPCDGPLALDRRWRAADTSAVSSTVRPPKNRSSTIRA